MLNGDSYSEWIQKNIEVYRGRNQLPNLLPRTLSMNKALGYIMRSIISRAMFLRGTEQGK